MPITHTNIRDEEVIKDFEATYPANPAKLVRLSLFTRIVAKPIPLVLAAVASAKGAPRSWVDSVQRDLDYIANNEPKAAEMVGASTAVWANAIAGAPKALAKLFHQALRAPHAQPSNLDISTTTKHACC